MLLPLPAFCCGSATYPAAVTEIACVLACPATKPTASSFDAVGGTDPDAAEDDDVAVPTAASSGLAVAIPENSKAWRATAAALVVTVMLLTGAALAANHISPREYFPDTAKAPAAVQVLVPSLTPVMGRLTPV